MKQQFERGLACVFIAAAIAVCIWLGMSKPRVLILHSYDQDYGWCRDESVGLKRVLDRMRGYVIRWYYMDAKRRPWPDHLNDVGMQVRGLVEEWRPSIIIAADDEAQEYVAHHYVNHPGISVVFLGINGSVGGYGYEKATNVTGIFERLPLDAVKEAILDLAHPNPGQVIRVLSMRDGSEAAQKDDEFTRKFAWAPLQLVDSSPVRTMDEWKRQVREAEGKADFIVAANYRQLAVSEGDRNLVPSKEIVAWTEANSRLPIIAMKESYAEDGGTLAIAASGYEQGETAAKMAVQILEGGRKANELPFVYPRMFLVSMRGSGMRAHRMELPRLYEASARAAGKYYE